MEGTDKDMLSFLNVKRKILLLLAKEKSLQMQLKEIQKDKIKIAIELVK